MVVHGKPRTIAIASGDLIGYLLVEAFIVNGT